MCPSWVQNHPNEPNKTQLSQGTVTGLKEIDMGRTSGWFVIILMIINIDILNGIVVKVGYSFLFMLKVDGTGLVYLRGGTLSQGRCLGGYKRVMRLHTKWQFWPVGSKKEKSIISLS